MPRGDSGSSTIGSQVASPDTASARDTERGLAGVAYVASCPQSLGGEICLILRRRSALAGVSVRL
jgi:hypothetical protein